LGDRQLQLSDRLQLNISDKGNKGCSENSLVHPNHPFLSNCNFLRWKLAAVCWKVSNSFVLLSDDAAGCALMQRNCKFTFLTAAANQFGENWTEFGRIAYTVLLVL